MKFFIITIILLFSINLDAQENPCSLHGTEDYHLSGYSWDNPNLKYYFKNFTSDLTQDQIRQAFSDAFNKWANVTGLTFIETLDQNEADITLRWHIEGSFHNSTSTFALTYYPPPYHEKSGDMEFNDNINWKVQKVGNGSSDLRYVALHEIGHVLGLCHSGNSDVVMYYPFAHKLDLTQADINGITSIYIKVKTKNEFNNPDGSISNGGLVNVENQDYNTNNEPNYEKILTFNNGSQRRLEAKEQNFLSIDRKFNSYVQHNGGWFFNDGFENVRIGTSEIINTNVSKGIFKATYRYKTNIGLTAITEFNGTIPTGLTIGQIFQYDSDDITAPPQYQPIGSNLNYSFAGWADDLAAPNSRNITPTNNQTYTALYKYTNHSDSPTAYSNSSQRKFIRTDDGNLHSVYESMGKVWYEISANNGSTWQIANNGRPLSGSNEGKLPSIDYSGNFVVIVWQEKEGGAYDIEAAKFSSFGYIIKQATIFMDIDLPYSTNTNPIVAIDGEGRILFIWKRDEDNIAYWPVGIIFCYGSFGTTSWTEMDFGLIPNTNSNSINPTIVADKDYNLLPAEYHLAWEQPSGSYSYIKYFELYRDGYNKIKTRTASPENPSDGAGFWTNGKPSIIVLNDHTPRLVWIGYTPWYGSRTVLRAKQTNNLWSSTIYNYAGYYSESTSINRTNDNNYAFAFNSTNNGYQNKYVKNSSLYTIRNLNTTGKDIQVCNGTNLQLMAAMVFNRTALPYYFTKSTTDFSSNLLDGGSGLNKITQNDTIITFGRSGIASINNIEFVFNIGDILVGDSIIKFIDTPDTLIYLSTDELNQQTKTNIFTLTPTTNFYFSNIYSVVQNSNPDSALTVSDAVNFKVELVNANTNQVVGTFDNITYNKNNLEKYASIDYEVDCSGITAGEYYLRLVTDVNGNANYSLANIITDNTTLAKKSFNKVNFMGSEIPISYELSINFPNPFNPSTTIRYQIPQDGIVTLKIYDILGSEVATLVNEEKLAGKYEVNFNASSLASGVYIYKIQAGSFINSKKMILLK